MTPIQSTVHPHRAFFMPKRGEITLEVMQFIILLAAFVWAIIFLLRVVIVLVKFCIDAKEDVEFRRTLERLKNENHT